MFLEVLSFGEVWLANVLEPTFCCLSLLALVLVKKLLDLNRYGVVKRLGLFWVVYCSFWCVYGLFSVGFWFVFGFLLHYIFSQGRLSILKMFFTPCHFFSLFFPFFRIKCCCKVYWKQTFPEFSFKSWKLFFKRTKTFSFSY